MPVATTSTIKNPPRLPVRTVAEAILGKRYDLSLVFIGPTRAKTLNETTRGKDYIPNVLSFPLHNTTGEIFICPAVAKREAKKFNLTPQGYLTYLLIHGCLHLKGFNHGAAMDKAEAKFSKQFKLR
jgi:probable rRNA maturation factor